MTGNIVGPPARGEDFFDREELVELLWNRLEGGNVLLAAPRRFGKTSLMYRLLDDPRPGWAPVHVDAESIREPVNFIIALLDALVRDQHIRDFLRRRLKGAAQWAREFVDAVELSGPWDAGAKVKFKERIKAHWQDRGAALLRTLCNYDKADRLLIVIDELPVMLSLFRDNEVSDADARAFLYWFRKLRTDPQVGLTNCRFLIGGSLGIEHYLSQLDAADSFNDFERVGLPELPQPKAAELVRRLLAARDLKLSTAAQRKMLELMGAPIPYFIQIFVSGVAGAVADGITNIGPKHIEAIYEDRLLGAACKTYFQHYYDRLRHYEKPQEQAAKALLKALALAQPEPVGRDKLRAIYRKTLGEAASDEGFARLLGDLENDFYIRRDTDGGYRFASNMLCDWWRRYYAF
jgi:hypothetical protein